MGKYMNVKFYKNMFLLQFVEQGQLIPMPNSQCSIIIIEGEIKY